MSRYIDLSKLTTPQLLALKSALVGQIATSDVKETARRLKAENAELKRREKYREICASYELDFDDDPDFYLYFSEAHLHTTCKLLSNAKKQTALAERFGNRIAIPPMFGAEELSSIDLVREGFKNRKNGNGRG